jgi:hypothetical protein
VKKTSATMADEEHMERKEEATEVKNALFFSVSSLPFRAAASGDSSLVWAANRLPEGRGRGLGFRAYGFAWVLGLAYESATMGAICCRFVCILGY